MSDFFGKVVLVTGSARGIGKAIAERFGKLGASVVVNYSSSEKPARETAAEIERLGGKAIAVQADVGKVADIERLFTAAIDGFGHLDIVVANAGIEQVDHPIADVTEAEFDKLYGVNAKGAFFTLNMPPSTSSTMAASSTSAQAPPAFRRPATASTAAASSRRASSSRCWPRNRGTWRHVNSILPSATEGAGVSTDEVRPAVREFVRQFHPIQRLGTLDDIAKAAEFLAGWQASFISGRHLLLSGGGPA